MKYISSIFIILIFVGSLRAERDLTNVQPLDGVKTKPGIQLDKSPSALGISAEAQSRLSKATNPPLNIALFAVDRRDEKENGNSDVIMIISIDQQNKKVKMSSVLRDTYVDIEGHPKDKINAAYALGGPQLAIKTINQNFDLDISDYINVDFFGAAEMVDALGGVNIDVQAEEIPYLNNYLQEIAIIDKQPQTPVTKPGYLLLNGKQTVAYTRIRAVGRGDYVRTERQRNVMLALFKKLKGSGPQVFPAFMSQILPHMETSMSTMTLFKVGSSLLASKNKSVEQARFPLDSSSEGIRVNNIWYLSADLKTTSIAMHNFIYKDIPPHP